MNIVIFTYHFNESSGGITALYNLAKNINELFNKNISVKMFCVDENCEPNTYCSDYANISDINDNTIVIYPEVIHGNPLNAKNVVRWILAPIGMNVPCDIANTWGKSDLVYYFNSEIKFESNPEKIGSIYKYLTILNINSYIQKYNFEERIGICYTIRKGKGIHKNNLYTVHPIDSFEITHEHTQPQSVEFFNKYKFFISYDSLTFYTVIAALCGCISIVYKVQGLNKQQWIQTTVAAEYLKSKGLDNLYGIAYGQENMQYAADTIHLVKEQWDDILKFNKEKTIVPFINDIKNFKNMQNTVQNNYFL